MVLEDLFSADLVKRRPYIAFFFGLFFSFVGFIVSWLFFRNSISVSMVFLTTFLLIPTLNMLIKVEEKIEGKEGLKHFFKNHKAIFEAYFFGFSGVFVAYLFMGFITYDKPDLFNSLFQFQLEVLKFQGVTVANLDSFIASAAYGWSQFVSLFSHNMLVLLICFVLSFFYGASAIFLVILNGSVFANFIIFIMKNISQDSTHGLKAFLFFLIHMLPEISGFLIAAIAGGVVSKALIMEKKGSKRFRNVFKDAFILMLIAIACILVGALLETFVSSALFKWAF